MICSHRRERRELPPSAPSLECIMCTLQNVIHTVGADLLSFLHPKELFLLSIVDHKHYEALIHQYILPVCSQHLQTTIKLGTGTNYLIELDIGRSFSEKSELWDHIIARVKPQLYSNDKSDENASIKQIREMSVSQSNIRSRGGNGNPIIIASCNIEQRNREVARGLANYMMDRDACRHGLGKEHYNFVRDWLNYLIHLRDITIQYWEWDLMCNGKREFGKGLIFSSNSSDVVEARLTRFY